MGNEIEKLGRLSETEMEVMHEIWQMDSPVTVSRLLKIFTQRREWKISTMSTILDRLIEKGFLSKKMEGKANIYLPKLTEIEYKKYETEVFLEKIHHGSIKSFVAALAGYEKLDTDEVAEIRAWFSKKASEL
jgi:BlaI family penicillinase repressor